MSEATVESTDDRVILLASHLCEFKAELAQLNRDINALEYKRNLLKIAIQGAAAIAELETLPRGDT